MPAAMNKQNREIRPNHVLSETDKAFITINYPRPPNYPPADSIWTMNHALDVVGIDPETKSKILESYELSEWAEIRYLLSGFCTTACRTGSIKRLQVVERSNGVVDGPSASSVSKVDASTDGAVDFSSAVSQVIPDTDSVFDAPSAVSNIIPSINGFFDVASTASNVITSTNGFFDVPSDRKSVV